MSVNILLIDDDPLVLKSLVGFFQSRGFTIFGCRTGSEAVKTFEDHPIHLIITDIRMHGIDGIEALQQIREIEKRKGLAAASVIMMTAYADQEARDAAAKLSVCEYFSKPFDISDLLKCVEKCAAEVSRSQSS